MRDKLSWNLWPLKQRISCMRDYLDAFLKCTKDYFYKTFQNTDISPIRFRFLNSSAKNSSNF